MSFFPINFNLLLQLLFPFSAKIVKAVEQLEQLDEKAKFLKDPASLCYQLYNNQIFVLIQIFPSL